MVSDWILSHINRTEIVGGGVVHRSLSLCAVRHYARSNNTIVAHLIYMLDTRWLLKSEFQSNSSFTYKTAYAAKLNEAHTEVLG